MAKSVRWVLALSIFIILILVVEDQAGWQWVLAQWQTVHPLNIAILVLLTAMSYVTRAVRIFYYFASVKSSPFLPYLSISLLHNAWNNFLPMRLGEASFPIMMKKQLGFSYWQTSGGLFLIRLFDLHVLTSLFLLAASIAVSKFYFVLLIFWLLLPVIIKPLLLILPRIFFAVKLLSWLSKFKQPQVKTSQLTCCYLLTIFIWVFKLTAFTLIAMSFLPLTFGQTLLAVISADFTSVLPIHGLAGSGTFEGAMLAVLLPLGVDTRTALSAAVNLHIYLLIVSLVSVPLAIFIKNSRSIKLK
ncbi:lysylphosphatidylglycerol synthase transmembrane domain-containing protein [Gayadomonas joobiniege]|uniref:lysylphosphatidylglycerol synthase transmembrane domain-containing protein n=1 Tax=Gayadomonas joobiniege TaxID=1234606 RepID=UPI00037E7182|nr:lysylphosphatidylglycerol synthase transmembrane domain-containing protein [Gayadomonas joobiniege]